MIKSVEITGIRSFKNKTTIELGIPNGENGSGLTIIVGANNSGKSTFVESLSKFNSNDKIFDVNFRNSKSDYLPKILLNIEGEEGTIFLESKDKNTSYR